MSTVLKKYKIIILSVITAILLTTHIIEAVQVVPYSADLSVVRISKDHQTRIRFPEHIRKAFVSDDVPLDVQLEKQDAYLKFESPYSKTINVFFVGDHDTYSLMLMPAAIKDSIVYIQGRENREEKAVDWEKGNIYEEMLAELIRMIYHGKIPPGYKAKMGGKDESPFNEVKMERELTMKGALYTAVQYKLQNISQTESRYSEDEFYRPGTVAVSIVKHKLSPGEATKIFFITKEFD